MPFSPDYSAFLALEPYLCNLLGCTVAQHFVTVHILALPALTRIGLYRQSFLKYVFVFCMQNLNYWFSFQNYGTLWLSKNVIAYLKICYLCKKPVYLCKKLLSNILFRNCCVLDINVYNVRENSVMPCWFTQCL